MTYLNPAHDEKIFKTAALPLLQLETICSKYGHSFIGAGFSQLMEQLGAELIEHGWLEGEDSDIERALRVQSCISAVSEQTGYKLRSEAVSHIAKRTDYYHEQLSEEKQKNWVIYETKAYVAEDAEGLLFFMKYRKLDYGYFELTLFVCFPEICRELFNQEIKRLSFASHFDQNFSQQTNSGPFSQKMIGENRFGSRDYSVINFVAETIHPHNVRSISQSGLEIPSAFMQIKMTVFMM